MAPAKSTPVASNRASTPEAPSQTSESPSQENRLLLTHSLSVRRTTLACGHSLLTSQRRRSILFALFLVSGGRSLVTETPEPRSFPEPASTRNTSRSEANSIKSVGRGEAPANT
ncbi:unnamed protein product, partial [Nesidiocoris tenuis]